MSCVEVRPQETQDGWVVCIFFCVILFCHHWALYSRWVRYRARHMWLKHLDMEVRRTNNSVWLALCCFFIDTCYRDTNATRKSNQYDEQKMKIHNSMIIISSSVITIKRDLRWLEDGYVPGRKSLQNHRNPNMQGCTCLRLTKCFAWYTVASSSPH